MQYSARRVPQAVAVFLTVVLLVPVVTAGSTLGTLLFLPMPAPDLPEPRTAVGSRVTHIYDVEGKEIGVLRQFDTNIPVRPDDIPEVLKDAVVAQEDRRFYSHGGVDLKAGIRALWANLTGGRTVQGGSTITQQYVKNAYTGGERTLARKLREAVVASRLDKELTKDEILYRYLENIYLGGGAYGVGAAAESYFKKRVNDLTLSEAALLAGLIASPSSDEPRGNPADAERQRLVVLEKMRDQDRITEQQYAEARTQRIVLVGSDGQAPPGPATAIHPLEAQSATEPFFVDYVRRYLIARYGDDLVYRGGLRVETSLDVATQARAEASVAKALGGTSPPLEMALVAVEPGTGLVKALVGGRDFEQSKVNLALGGCAERGPDERARRDTPVCIDGGGSGRQPGSSFKPITLAKAFEMGIGPSRVYSGPASYTFPGCSGSQCTVKNVESGAYGAITLRQATHQSVNTVYAQLIGDVGVTETAEMAHRLGVTMVSPDGKRPDGSPYGASLTLGSAEVSPLDMAAAFSVFANRGVQQAATPVVRVLDAEGGVLEDNARRRGNRVLDEKVADNVNDVLKGVVAGGTGRSADIGRPGATAGKTGTSENFGNAWFVGYTPALSTAVWMGYSDAPRPLERVKGVSRVYGGTIPAQTWKDFMGEAMKGVQTPDFPVPPAIGDEIAPGPRKTPDEPAGGPFVVVGAPLPVSPTTTVPLAPATTTVTTRPGLRIGPPTTRSPGLGG
ncbi:MAG TPA: transglycosylase domain-containing protein [Acidimicrobiales bacterium]|nr:transglycosylase domain-containing protein [Acidimicrobiales bacterium]